MKGVLDESKRFGFGEAQPVAQPDHRAQDRGVFDFAARSLGFRFRPAQSARATVFPEISAVAEPVPGVLTRLQVVFARHHAFDQAAITAVVAHHEPLVEVARDGQMAEIVVGQSIYLPSGVTYTTVGGTGGTVPSINGSYQNVGIQLDVTPFIGANSLCK